MTPGTVRPLGDLIEIKHGFAFDGRYFTDSGPFRLLTPGNFAEAGGFVDKGNKQKQYDGPVSPEFILQPGALLVAMTEQAEGLLGSTAIVPEGKHCLHNQRLGLIRPREGIKVSLRFIYYLFNTPNVRTQIRATASGVKVRHTSPSRIQAVKAFVPPYAVQARLAAILGAYDDLIEVNRRRIGLLEEIARRLFDEWFVRFRFPGHENTSMTPASEGPLPAGWPWEPLQAICVKPDGVQTGPFGSQLHQSDYTDEGVPVVMPKNIVGLRVVEHDIARIPEALADQLGRHRMQTGDVVYGRRGDIGRRAYISTRERGWFCGTGCLRFRPDQSRIAPRYFFDALGLPVTFGAIKARAQGATMPNLSAGAVAGVPVMVPAVTLQKRYSETVEPLADLQATLADATARLSTSRDFLLPRLISGELCVAAAERELEAAA